MWKDACVNEQAVPIVVFLGLSVLDLGPVRVRDRQTSDAYYRVMLPPRPGRGISSVQFAKINVVLSAKHFRTTTQ